MTEQDEIKKQMKDITNAAHALYNAAKRDCPGIPTPTEWILQQDNRIWQHF